MGENENFFKQATIGRRILRRCSCCGRKEI